MDFPRITPLFDFSSDPAHYLLYSASLRSALHKILPRDFFEEEKARYMLQDLLPQISSFVWEKGSLNLTVFLLCPFRPHASKFFYEMLSRWLLPGRCLHVGLFFSTDFKLPDLGQEIYTLAELILHLSSEEELNVVQRALKILEGEIRLGVSSVYHASRILEIKGLSADEKTALIQEKIGALMQRRPLDFDDDIYSQMQHFLVTCREEFRVLRSCHHMSRIISILYLFRKKLREEQGLLLKLVRVRLNLALGVKSVLAVFIGMRFLKENEVFAEKHLLKALQACIPGCKIVEESVFFKENKEEKLRTIYLEIEKVTSDDFTQMEIRKLRQRLPQEIRAQVEHLIRPTFMPRNEEEVMRNLITLSKQVRKASDLPQVVISFDSQTDSEIIFSVSLVRVASPDAPPLPEIFPDSLFDRIKKIGNLRGKYFKEAAVMRVKLPAADFLRSDHAVDLYKARHALHHYLEKHLGEVRDYNGGMIAKQHEAFFALQKLLGDLAQEHVLLLENFFHAIFPIEWRSVLDPQLLSRLFHMLLRVQDGPTFQHQYENGVLFMMLTLKDLCLKEPILETVSSLKIPPAQLACLHLKNADTLYLGYIYMCDEPTLCTQFLDSISINV